MKKISLILLSFVVLKNEASSSSFFNGFYVGGHLGWAQQEQKTALQEGGFQNEHNINYSLPGNQKSKKVDTLNYGLSIGYGQTNKAFYIGAEAGIEGDTLGKNIKYYELEPMASGFGMSFKGEGQAKLEYQRGIMISFAPRVGAVIDQRNLIYLKFGIGFSRDTLKGYYAAQIPQDAYTSHKEFRQTKSQFVFIPAIGYERAFGKVLFRFEYGYNTGGKIKGPNLVPESTVSPTVKYTAHIFKIGLSYKF